MAHGSHEVKLEDLSLASGLATVRVISWNLLRQTGATVKDVAALIEQYHPDFFLMQEVIEELAALPAIVGGHFFREHLHGRIYGLATWSRYPLPPPYALLLPVSTMPGRVPPRVAQIVCFGGVTFANVHLSHGQFLNRWQLTRIARSLDGPVAVVGDYNAVGPVKLSGFKDVGPRKPTHVANKIMPFRLDRCMVRGLHCTDARVLDRGPSDHHPIILDLHIMSSSTHVSEPHSTHEPTYLSRHPLRASLGRFFRVISQSADHIAVPRAFTVRRNLQRTGRKRAQNRIRRDRESTSF